jgi:hypothetical protein
MGLLVGTTFYPVISVTKRHRIFMWCFRIIAIPLTIVLFIVLIRNFYTSNPYAGMSFCDLDSRICIDSGPNSLYRVPVSLMFPNECK